MARSSSPFRRIFGLLLLGLLAAMAAGQEAPAAQEEADQAALLLVGLCPGFDRTLVSSCLSG
jgi:hypothetical protein